MFFFKRALYIWGPILLLLGIWVIGFIGCAAKKEILLPPWKGKYPVLVIAHRGFSGQFPENTLLAFKKAIELGCDMIELDVQLSKDGEVVVLHDDTLDRTTNGKGRVSDFKLEEIKKLDAGLWLGAQFSGERIPVLKEILSLSKAKIPVNVEIKPPKEGQYSIEKLVERALREVKDAGMVHQVNFISFHPAALRRIKEKEPKAWVTVLYHKEWNTIQEITRGADFPILGLSDQHLTKEKIAKIHGQGMQVYVWTVDNPEEMEKFIQWGADGIITNHPDLLIKILNKKFSGR